ncbi:hypothetical protein D3C77_806380 [compost metagenome]
MYGSEFKKVIPGKQLLQLFISYLSTYTDGKGVNRVDFENIACHCCDLSTLYYLKDAINNYLTSYRAALAG